MGMERNLQNFVPLVRRVKYIQCITITQHRSAIETIKNKNFELFNHIYEDSISQKKT